MGEVGERALIRRITERLPAAPEGELWAGDDAAVITAGQTHFVLTIDTLTDKLDFDLSRSSGNDAGWKAMAANVSDIAAMGATPRHAVVSLSLPPDTAMAVADGIAAGLAEAAERWRVGLAGGDVGAASELSITIAMTGEVGPHGPVLRSGAAAGHALCVTGFLGGAAAGLRCLQGSLEREPQAHEKRLRARQLRPQARPEAGLRLAGLASAMIDVSDGLAVDLANLLDASAAGCEIDPEEIPVDPDILLLAAQSGWEELDPLLLALTGGEDYELLFALEETALDSAGAALRELGVGMTRIGTVVTGGRRVGTEELDHFRSLGWQHLQDH
ncbi:MAG: thiamine-phosphate kinase [Actinomycetota bacterium]|nr:thiamine-phosphate kinase [Actinomycetota bacterium]